MKFEQTRKHQGGGFGSRSLFGTDEEAERALHAAVEIKPGLRAVQVADGRVAIFRNSSKKPGTFGYDLWHGGWEANGSEMGEIGGTRLPTFIW
jgi:hypothetical protein